MTTPTLDEALHLSKDDFTAQYDSGLWLTQTEAALAAGCSQQNIARATVRPNNPLPVLYQHGTGRRSPAYSHIGWLADFAPSKRGPHHRWQSGPGVAAWQAGEVAYREWFQATVIPLRNRARAKYGNPVIGT